MEILISNAGGTGGCDGRIRFSLMETGISHDNFYHPYFVLLLLHHHQTVDHLIYLILQQCHHILDLCRPRQQQ